jgi:signal recognition particle subunit SRP54
VPGVSGLRACSAYLGVPGVSGLRACSAYLGVPGVTGPACSAYLGVPGVTGPRVLGRAPRPGVPGHRACSAELRAPGVRASPARGALPEEPSGDERPPAGGAYTVRPVFDALSDKLQHVLGDLRGRGRLDDETVSKAMREIRLALLEADVNLQVVKDFVARVKERAAGEDVTKSLTPGQQVVKIVHEELTAVMGGGDSRLAFAGRPPTVILLAGLQGSGKTTAAAKLALMLRKEGKRPALVAADLRRPAAVDQLEQLGRQIQIPVYADERSDPVAAARKGVEWGAEQGADVVVVDTAGRHQVDEALMVELERIAEATRPTNILLVLDSMTGQEAVNVAEAFQKRVAFDGVVLTKLDGDARGGAALSVRAATGRPIKLASVGEKLDQLEWFHPDRMASRILGMGDVLTLIEKAEAAVEADEQAAMEERLRAGEFSFDDFLTSYRLLRKMGPLKGVLSMVPGLGNQLKGIDVDERELGRVEAIILSMTPRERSFPHVIDGSRRQRIARGSGTTVQEVSRLLNARKEMQKLMKRMGQGKLPVLPGMAGKR